MHRFSSSRTWLTAAAIALLVTSTAAACGVDASEDAGSPLTGGTATTTTSTEPCTDPGGTDGGNTGGTVGADDQLPDCSDPTPTTDDPTPTTTEDRTTTTTEGTGADEQAYVDALASQIVGRDDLGVPVTSDQADCIAPEWITTLDPDRLDEAGIYPETLAGREVVFEVLDELIGRPEATEMVAALTGCGIDLKVALATVLAANGNLTDDQVQCVVDALSDDYIAEVVAISLADGRDALDNEPGLTEPLTDAAAACQ